jgi:hypothetical protein
MFNIFSLFWHGSEGLALLATIFWIWTLTDCLTKEPSEGNDKVAWTILIIFVPLIGALLYHFVRRPERIKAIGQ